VSGARRSCGAAGTARPRPRCTPWQSPLTVCILLLCSVPASSRLAQIVAWLQGGHGQEPPLIVSGVALQLLLPLLQSPSLLFWRLRCKRTCRFHQALNHATLLQVYDESHKAKSLLPAVSSGQPTQTARAVVELQVGMQAHPVEPSPPNVNTSSLHPHPIPVAPPPLARAGAAARRQGALLQRYWRERAQALGVSGCRLACSGLRHRIAFLLHNPFSPCFSRQPTVMCPSADT
jgi:hypothetical protein